MPYIMIIQKTYPLPLSTPPSSFSPDPHPHIYEIIHNTEYSYSAPVAFSKHLLRLQPVHDSSQTILNYECSISASKCNVCNFVGAFGNHASFLEIEGPYSSLTIISRSSVAVQELPKRLDLLHQPRTLPMIWMPWDRIMMQAYLQPPELPESDLFELAEYAMSFVKKSKNDIYALLLDMTETIYKEYTYAAGTTSLATTPYEVYRTRRGVCQDFSNLLICLLRLIDIPARYRTGYLFTGTDYVNKEQGDATHAWVEMYCPYIGWIGADPTNGCLADKNHIKLACGRYYTDATPTSGTLFTAEGPAHETLTTTVQVHKI
jgi:transglutaminase-like putative cysteine protease